MYEMSGIKQPITQVRLTNVATVRLKANGNRFEIACYKNKVSNWRDGVETDIDEVLQSRHIFTNVSKGVLAKHDQLQQAFGTTDSDFIARRILSTGVIQISELERSVTLDTARKDIASYIANSCVNPTTHRPYTQRMIESAIKSTHYSVRLNKSAKSQAQTVIRMLKSVIDIERAHMKCRVTVSGVDFEKIKPIVQELSDSPEGNQWEQIQDNWETTILIDPGVFRDLEQGVKDASTKDSSVSILDLKVVESVDEDDDDTPLDNSMAEMSISKNRVERAPIIMPSEDRSEQLEKIAKRATNQPTKSKVEAAPVKSKKNGPRRRDDEEEIRTVGERHFEEDDETVIEDSAVTRQKQQQLQAKQKKLRKQQKAKSRTSADKEESEDELSDSMPLPNSRR